MLKYLQVEGSPYELGLALGRFGKDAVHTLLLPSSAWASVMAWRGSAAVAAMQQLTQERFPAIWSEIEGLAAGLELPLDEVLADARVALAAAVGRPDAHAGEVPVLYVQPRPGATLSVAEIAAWAEGQAAILGGGRRKPAGFRRRWLRNRRSRRTAACP